MSTTTSTWDAHVRSDVFEGPQHPEDGSRREELAYSIVLTDAQGNRFQSYWTRTTLDHTREECEDAARRHQARVERALSQGADPRTSDRWAVTDPMYGSAAWTSYGEADQVARERAEG